MSDWQESTQIAPPFRCVLFADVVGWTKMCERLGDAHAKALVDAFFDDLVPIVRTHRGEVVKRIGDELMCLFDSAGLAAHAASDMQRFAEARNRTAQVPLFLRAGFQAGPVILDKGDCYGDTVNTAARIAGTATRGLILTTRETANLLPQSLTSRLLGRQNAALKGKEDAVEIVEVDWRDGVRTDYVPPAKRSIPPIKRLLVRCLGDVHVLEQGGGALQFGRDKANDLVVRDPHQRSLVSGNHGHFEWRGGAIEFVDTSRNGTFLRFDGDNWFKVDKPVTVRAGGQLALGGQPGATGVVMAEFEVEC